jgi:hypothetical protein
MAEPFNEKAFESAQMERLYGKEVQSAKKQHWFTLLVQITII